MKRSEKILLAVFAALFVVIVGGGLLFWAVGNYRSILEENNGLSRRVTEMNEEIAQGAEWQRRSAWLENHVPAFASRQDASSRLLEAVQREASKVGLSIAGKEFLEAPRLSDADAGAEAAGTGGYFDQASVKITLSGAREKALFTWLHALQQPAAFLGVTRLQINPGGQGKAVNVEVEITQYYREKPAAKVSTAVGARRQMP